MLLCFTMLLLLLIKRKIYIRYELLRCGCWEPLKRPQNPPILHVMSCHDGLTHCLLHTWHHTRFPAGTGITAGANGIGRDPRCTHALTHVPCTHWLGTPFTKRKTINVWLMLWSNIGGYYSLLSMRQ